MTEGYRHLDLEIDQKQYENGILEVLKCIRPKWNKGDIDIKFLSGGFINKVYSIHLKSDVDITDGLVIRINSPAIDCLGADRPTELRVLLAMNSDGPGVPLIASFKNGLVFRFIKGKGLTDEQMRDQHFIRLIAIGLAQMHAKLPLNIDPRNDPLHLIRKCFDNVPKVLDDPEQEAIYRVNIPYAELASEYSALLQHVLAQDLDVAISHGDMWQGNVLYNEETDSLTFIDFENSGLLFAGFDLGFYLITLAGTPPDYKNYYPTNAVRKYFVHQYLQEKLRMKGFDFTNKKQYEHEFKRFYVQTCQCEMLALMYLLCMTLFDETIKNTEIHIDFDFMSMAIDAWDIYKAKKKVLLGLTVADIDI